MRFSLLGPLIVADSAGDPVAIAGRRLRVLLAALLLRANIPVPADELAEMVWDGSPPPGAAVSLRSYVKRLRRTVDPEAARIAASDPGYLIRVERAELDVLEFEALCRDARTALRADECEDASAAATRALGLWRGVPLLDVPAEGLRDEFVPRLEQLRLQVLEDRFDAGLRLGHHQELIPQLLEATAQYPLEERFRAQLMLALASTGRRAQALHVYQEARQVLVDELGIEPGRGQALSSRTRSSTAARKPSSSSAATKSATAKPTPISARSVAATSATVRPWPSKTRTRCATSGTEMKSPDSSTSSESTQCRDPTPLAASASAATPPAPPTPRIVTRASRSRASGSQEVARGVRSSHRMLRTARS